MSFTLDKILLLAIEYIQIENRKDLKPYPKTLTSFVAGKQKSPFYSFFSLHLDVCGKYPYTDDKTVIKRLKRLVYLGLVREEVSASGKTGYYLVKKICVKKNITNTKPIKEKTIKEKRVIEEKVLFSDTVNEFERKVLKQFNKLIIELLPDHELKENKITYGFAPIHYDGDFPRKRCWISRDNKSKNLVLKFRKEVNSSEKTLPLGTNEQVTEAFRQLRVSYSSSINEIELIVNRIKEKDLFEDYKTENLKDIELMPHQKAGVELSKKYDRFAFFYDTGTGKTIMSLEIIMQKHINEGARFLIIAPKALIKNAWMDDSKHFKGIKLLPLSKNIKYIDYAKIYDYWEELDGREKVLTDDEGNLKDNIFYKYEDLIQNLKERADHFIINIDAVREPQKGQKLLEEIKCNGLIIDESVIIKNRESGNSVRMRVFSRKMKYVYLLSGKPAPNSTIEYFSQMEIVDPETFNMTYKAFIKKYYKKVGFNRLVDKNDSTRKEVARMVGNRSIIIQKEDCIVLPPATHKKISVEMDEKSLEFYQDIIRRFVAEIIDMNGKHIKINPLSKLASIMKLREVASGFYLDKDSSFQINMQKIDVINELIDEIGYDANGKHNKVLIWCTFKYEIETLENFFIDKGYNVVTAYSKTKDVDRSVHDFQYGDADIMIAHPQTLKYGVTLTNCHYCIYSSMSYSFDNNLFFRLLKLLHEPILNILIFLIF